VEMSAQPGPIGAGPFHPDDLDVAEAGEPADQTPIADRRRVEGLHPQQTAPFIERGGDMAVEVGVDTTSDSCSPVCQGEVRHLRYPIV